MSQEKPTKQTSERKVKFQIEIPSSGSSENNQNDTLSEEDIRQVSNEKDSQASQYNTAENGENFQSNPPFFGTSNIEQSDENAGT